MSNIYRIEPYCFPRDHFITVKINDSNFTQMFAHNSLDALR